MSGGLLELGLRPLRLFAPVMVVAFVACAVATAVTAASAATSRPTVVGSGRPGEAITLSADRASGGLVVLTARPDDASTTTADTCSLSDPRHRAKVTYSGVGGPTLTRDGATYRRFAAVKQGWIDGETLTCTGPHLQDVLVVEHDRPARLAFTGLLAFMTLGTGVMALLGLRLRRRSRPA